MFWYPVQRQRLPDSAQRTSSSVGSGFSSSSALAVSIIPGVQKPHCRPCSSLKPSWMGCSSLGRRQALDRGDLVTVGLDGEHRAALDRLAVEQDRAGAAVRRVAAGVGAGQVEALAQQVGQQQPGLDLGGARVAVDGDRDPPDRDVVGAARALISS